MFGYLDESGSPGKATKINDYFVISLVLFENDLARQQAIDDINNLRIDLNLPEDYEFHCSRNTNRVQNAFVDTLSRLDFSFITIALKKDKYGKTATNIEIAEKLIEELVKYCQKVKIEMDTNPRLHDRIRREIRKRGLVGINVRERKSKNNQLIQIADYVVNISFKHIKKPVKTQKWFDAIRSKCLAFVVVPE